MKILVRDYANTDRKACCKLWGELQQYHADIYGDPAIASGDPARYFVEYLGRPGRCGTWVAENNGRIVGFAGLLDVVGEEGIAEIEPVVVSRSSRGVGIGTTLIEHVKNEAKVRNFRFLTVRPELRNIDAFSLYVGLGFNRVGSIELFQELSAGSDREWKSGIEIHGVNLLY